MKSINSPLFLIVIALVCSACEKQNSLTDVPANSLAYYDKNPIEAKQVSLKCLDFEKNEFSTMSPSKQKAWAETSSGINCNNAKYAYSNEIMRSRNRAMAESNKKYH